MAIHISRWLAVLVACAVIVIGGIVPRLDFDNQVGPALTFGIEAQACVLWQHTLRIPNGTWNFFFWTHTHFHEEPILWCQ